MTPNGVEIKNYNQVIDNSLILDEVNASINSECFNKEKLNIGLDVIENVKSYTLVRKNKIKLFVKIKIFLYPIIEIFLNTKKNYLISNKLFLFEELYYQE